MKTLFTMIAFRLFDMVVYGLAYFILAPQTSTFFRNSEWGTVGLSAAIFSIGVMVVGLIPGILTIFLASLGMAVIGQLSSRKPDDAGNLKLGACCGIYLYLPLAICIDAGIVHYMPHLAEWIPQFTVAGAWIISLVENIASIPWSMHEIYGNKELDKALDKK